MQLVHFYLNFPGTAKAAFQFYETVFGTKIAMIQTFGQASFMPNVPEAAKDKILHIQLPMLPSPISAAQAQTNIASGAPKTFPTNFEYSLQAIPNWNS